MRQVSRSNKKYAVDQPQKLLVKLLFLAALFTSLQRSGQCVESKNVQPHWQINNNEAQLLDAQGKVKKAMPLGKVAIEEMKNTTAYKAFPSKDGHYLVIGKQDPVIKPGTTEPISFKTSASCYDSNGTVIWSLQAVDLDRGVWIADDGSRSLIVSSNPDFCSSEEDIDCIKTIEILDSRGNIVAKLGPYRIISQIYLTDNGKFGMAQIWNGPSEKDKRIFFNGEGHILTSIDTVKLPGEPQLKDNGVIEFVKFYYGPIRNDGMPPQAKKIEIIKKLKLE